MSDIHLQEAAAAEAVAQDARPKITPPETRDEADKITINVHNAAPAKPDPVAEAQQIIDAGLVTKTPPAQQPVQPAAVVPPAADSQVVTAGEFERAERNLAAYLGSWLDQRNLGKLIDDSGVVLTLHNTYEHTREVGQPLQQALQFELSGAMVAPNYVLLQNELVNALASHPVLGPIVLGSAENATDYKPLSERITAHEPVFSNIPPEGEAEGKLHRAIENLTQEQYVGIIKALAKEPERAIQPVQPTAAAPVAIKDAEITAASTSALDALKELLKPPATQLPQPQDAVQADDVTTGTIFEKPGAEPVTKGTVFEPPKQGTKTTALEAEQAAVMQADAQTQPLEEQASTRVQAPVNLIGRMTQEQLAQGNAIRA